MSTSVFPALSGLGWGLKRSAMWKTNVQESVSGKETAIGYWSYPRWQWDLSYEFLRGDVSNAEFQSLSGFFNQMQGRYDTFLFLDADDNSVTAQSIGTGDGVTTAFQLKRTMGGFTEPVFAPNAVSNVKVNGVTKTVTSDYLISVWGSTTPGILTFVSAPANGHAIVADLTYRFPCRFADDKIDFEKFMTQLWSSKAVVFRSIK